jgi:ketosteroid isomerase-like protein
VSVSAADRVEILDVVGRADAAATSRDARAYADLFTDDAVLDGTQGHHAGSAALLNSVGPIWAAEGPATLHLTLNPVVEEAGGEAVVRSVMLIVALTSPITVRTAAAITQTLRRDAGSWKIARRTVSDPAAPGPVPAPGPPA